MPENNERQQRRFTRRPRSRREAPAQSEFFEKVIRINRICKTVAGGRRLRFNALIVVGDRKGKVGIGLAKSQEVAMAIDKARKKAYRDMKEVRVDGHTIPVEVLIKFKAVRVLLRPARKGRGIVAGQTLRALAEAAGIRDLVTKVMGSTNQVNIAQAGMKGLIRMTEMEIPRGRERAGAPAAPVAGEPPAGPVSAADEENPAEPSPGADRESPEPAGAGATA